MSTILCFGDSNTWGFDPEDEGRFPRAMRWPTVLGRELGPDANVTESGLNGRNTAHDDPQWQNRNGRKALPIILETHAPVDLVIFLLGLLRIGCCARRRSARARICSELDLAAFSTASSRCNSGYQ